MTKANQPKAEKAKNYTAEQEAAILAASPLDLTGAKRLADELGKSWRSVIAKAQSMEGVEYIAKAPEPKRPTPETKKAIVADIMAFTGWDLRGLEKATVRALLDLRGALLELCPDRADRIAKD